jgi:hypothetical protein
MLPVLVDFYDFQRNTTLIMDCDRYNTKVTLEAQSIKEYLMSIILLVINATTIQSLIVLQETKNFFDHYMCIEMSLF